ncbi:coiled-coil and C2 domain-containing protein 2A-like [Eriocheir sinensis]|uniref:coiled-coil and C2 domain-containing protein 2A-like n=1 Tax=Eriocheir sinensis TaxID=95602 RepID=UPI0021C71951|nr:coiled-coil and C2 domain-containing protein 2A-like [Eriocheir sinensis]
MRMRDVEGQAEGEAARFIPAALQHPPPPPLLSSGGGQEGGSESQVVLAGPSGTGERRKAGRLRKKLVGRGTTRFDEHIETAEPAPEASALDPRKLWQRAATEARATSRIEGEEFFTRIWPEEKPIAPSSPPGFSLQDIFSPSSSTTAERKEERKKREEEEEEEGEGFDEEGHMLVGVTPGTHPCPPTHQAPAVYVPLHLRRAQQRSTLFMPSSLPSDVRSKLEEGRSLRDPVEEGLYVGEKPFLTPANRNIVENRLLRQNNRHWFSETGSLERLNTPVSEQFHHHLPPHLQAAQHHKEAMTVFMEPQPNDSLLQDSIGGGGGGGGGVLDLELCGLRFTHHPLFSPEHVLAAQLTRDFTLYKERVSLGATRILQAKLAVLRQSLAKLRKTEPSDQTQQRPRTARDELGTTRRLEIYRREVKACREEANAEAERDRELVTRLLRVWKSIKELRRSSRVHATSIRLLIRKEEVEQVEEEEQRKVELEEEVREVLEERQLEFDVQSKRYEREMVAWRTEHRKRKEARRRQEERRRTLEEGSTMEGEEEEALIQAAQDDTLLATPEPPRPAKPPKPPLKHKIELEVLEVFSRTRKPPGEPVVSLELTQTTPAEPHTSCPDREKKRRLAVSKTRVWLRVLVNNKLVTQTPSTTLGPEFSLPLGHTFRMALSSWPRSLAVEVVEGAALRQALVASVALPIPGHPGTTRDAVEMVEFSGCQVVSHSHAGVGCGRVGSQYGSSFTTGELRYRLGWATGAEGEVLAPPGLPPATTTAPASPAGLKLVMPGAEGGGGGGGPGEGGHSLHEARLDPNDPANAALLDHLKKTGGGGRRRNMYGGGGGGRYLSLDGGGGLLAAWEGGRGGGVRLRVLELRDQGEPLYRDARMVPALECQVLRDPLQNFDQRTREMEEEVEAIVPTAGGKNGGNGDPHTTAGGGGGGGVRVLLGEGWGEELERRWERVEGLLASLRRRLQLRYSPEALAPSLEDLVREESIPDIGTLGSSLAAVFRARRPLRPTRRPRDRVRGAALTDQHVRLIVHVARAFNVPVRDPQQQDQGGVGGGGGDEGCVRTLVEVTFQRTTLSTSVAEGPNPTWNQQLSFPFRAPNDNFSPGSLQQVREDVFLHLYDQVTQDLLDDPRLRPSTLHHRLHHRWLGSLTIPFSTIYANAKIEGTFALEEPVVLLGYSRDLNTTPVHTTTTSSPVSSPPAAAGRFNTTNTTSTTTTGSLNTTHLSLYITLEPSLPPPEPLKAQFESGEPEEIVAAGREWVDSISARYPRRKFRTHVLDLSGRLVCLTRYLRPLQPPQELVCEDPAATVRRVAWFVSLIPSLADLTLFPGAGDIWANSEQFLTMLTGDEEEHAVLLTCFFLHLGKTAYLLLGSGVPEGETCYVVTEEAQGEWLVWQPSTGRCYNPRHPFSPLHAVHQLVTQDNIWGNVQKYDDPPRVNLDVSGSGWRPFFGRGGVRDPGLASVQPQRLDLLPPDAEQVKALQERLELSLRDAFMKWRGTNRTIWNRHAIKVLRKLIEGMEKTRISTTTTNTSLQHHQHPFHHHHHHHHPDLAQLAAIMTSHQVCGVCIHQGYSTAAGVVAAVHGAGVHLTQAPGVEFALAIHLHAYPGQVLSVWVYVAALLQRT